MDGPHSLLGRNIFFYLSILSQDHLDRTSVSHETALSRERGDRRDEEEERNRDVSGQGGKKQQKLESRWREIVFSRGRSRIIFFCVKLLG